MNKSQKVEEEVNIQEEETQKKFVIPDIITEDIGFELMFGFKAEAYEQSQYRRAVVGRDI